MVDLVDDVRYGLRVFRRQPALVALALAGLAVAMGVATAAFTYAERTFLRPMGVPDREAVVNVVEIVPQYDIVLGDVSLEAFETIQARATTLRAEAFYRSSSRVDDPVAGLADQALRTTFVSDTFLETFGARAAAGRLLGPADAAPSSAPAAVMLHAPYSVPTAVRVQSAGHVCVFNQIAPILHTSHRHA